MRSFLAIVALVACSEAWVQVTLPHDLQPNTKASASKVMENFNALNDALPPSDCTTDQIIKWSELYKSWRCADLPTYSGLVWVTAVGETVGIKDSAMLWIKTNAGSTSARIQVTESGNVTGYSGARFSGADCTGNAAAISSLFLNDDPQNLYHSADNKQYVFAYAGQRAFTAQSYGRYENGVYQCFVGDYSGDHFPLVEIGSTPEWIVNGERLLTGVR